MYFAIIVIEIFHKKTRGYDRVISPDEKRKCIEELNKLIRPEDVEKSIELIKNLLYSDTNNGKLYKYRSVNPYSIECLENGTLYCASPDEFNDPFDCKIGVSFMSMYEAKYCVEIDLVAKIFEDFLLILLNAKKIDDCDDKEQRILRKLLGYKELVDFATQSWERDTSLEKELEILNNNANLIAGMLQIILSDESLKDSLGICADMLPLLYERISPEGKLELLKGNNSISDFAKANQIYDDVDETELTLLINEKLCPEKDEDVKNVRKTLSVLESEISTKINSLFRIVCLATDYKNRLMWSHYSDSHKGFCIEYGFRDAVEKEGMIPLPILYSDKRPLVPCKAIIENTPENIKEATEQFMKGLLVKDKAWEYENEWRLLCPSSEKFVDMPKVTAIYLGVSISRENKEQIMQIAKDQNIPVFQMVIDRGEYDLHAILITE